MNQTFQRLNTLMGWVTFGIAATVYALTAEPTGSLWDCGEFVSAAHKLQVVHPPGAPLFLMVGRLFAIIGETFSSNPETIAYMVNLSSGICTAFLVLFIFWSTTILAKLALVGKGEVENTGQIWAILGAGLAAGLSSTFATSVWFSAVEGEVYAMSSFFTGLVLWAGLRWFISEDAKADRWLVFIAYMVGLSIGVHLLSLLIIPFVALLYYYKNYTNTEDKRFPWLGTLAAGAAGSGLLVFVQYFIIPRVPAIAAAVDYTFVNSFGTGVGMGMLFFAAVLALAVGAGIWYATKIKSYYGQLSLSSLAMVLIGFSTYGMIVLRANTNLPINMNAPADPYSLLSYLNREQYGDRPLFYGPHYFSEMSEGVRYKEVGNVYRPVTDAKGKTTYQVVDKKSEPQYKSKDMMFFPRLGHMDRVPQYMGWLGHYNEVEADFQACLMQNGGNPQACGMFDPRNPNAYRAWAKKNKAPSQADNFKFFLNYQIGHMYVRYFMWNFVGRQNAQQNFHTDSRKYQVGNWLSGIGFIDELYTHSQSNLPKYIAEDKGRNTYFFLPLIFGFMGMFYHFSRRPKEAFAIFALFILTGLAIIVFLNQPPQEPRERDYAFAGSFFTFCIWIGMAVPLIYQTLIERRLAASASAVLAGCLVLTAPIIMGYQNWDDHSRAGHYGARDYAINFLESCAPNAILFTYGDNDTYPLWYAQEVEGIRTDVRVVNFSLLAVDWYINQLRYKINESPRVKMSISPDAYRGKNRNFAPFVESPTASSLADIIKFIGESHPMPQYGNNVQSYVPTRNAFIAVDKAKARANGAIPADIPDSLVVDTMRFGLEGEYMIKDEIALMDIIATNAANGWERPIYFAVTCRPEKVMGLKDYLQLEGMALRVVPFKTPSAADMMMNMGRIDTETMFKNVTEKFKWGNFDKENLFVDESYMPSVQTTQYGMMRLATELMRLQQKEKAVKVADKFFEAYPNMNFPFAESRIITRDGKTVLTQMLGVYYLAGEESKAKQHIQTLVDGLADKQAFYQTLSGSDASTFAEDSQMNMFLMESLLNFVQMGKDEELKKELAGKVAAFGITLKAAPQPNTPQNNPQPQPADTAQKNNQ